MLRSGDQGDAVKSLQRGLNRMGAMLLVDGDFGASTSSAVAAAREEFQLPGPPEADEALQQAVAAVPDPCPALTAAGMTFIARQEVSDSTNVSASVSDADLSTATERRDDRHRLRLPFRRPARIRGRLDLAQTRSIYPQIDEAAMTPARRTALVSLVYNRGADLGGDRRREMRAIRDLLAAARLDDVAERFESMTRLWAPQKEGGLIDRRRAEATLWRSGFGALKLE